MKKFIALAVFTIFCWMSLSFVNEAAEAAHKYKLAAHYPAGYYVNNGFHRVADRVKKATNGEVEIVMYESGQLGGYEQAFQEVMRGTIDMTTNFPTSRFNPKFEIAYTPSLASGFDEISKLLDRKSPFHKFMEAAYKECGVVYIGSFVDTIAGASIVKGKTIKNPFDTSNKNCRLRVCAVDSARKWYSAMGYQLATIPYAEVFSSMQTGVIDGDSGSGPEGVYLVFKDVVGSYIEYQNLFFTLDFVISQKAWKSFDAKTQKAIIDAFDAERANVFNDAKKSYVTYLGKMKAEGIKIISPTKAQLAFMDEVAYKNSWPVCEQYTGKQVFNDIKKYMGKTK